MGCDIHSHAERCVNGKWESIGMAPFDWRSYGMYAFLAGIRNYSAVPPLAEPRGLPDDLSPDTREAYDGWGGDAHSASWLSVKELADFDYDRELEDRRVTRQTGPNSWSGAETCEPEKTTFRAFLGERFFTDLEKLRNAGAERVVFWFDN